MQGSNVLLSRDFPLRWRSSGMCLFYTIGLTVME